MRVNYTSKNVKETKKAENIKEYLENLDDKSKKFLEDILLKTHEVTGSLSKEQNNEGLKKELNTFVIKKK